MNDALAPLALEALNAAVGALVSSPLDGLGDDEVPALAVELERQRRRLAAADLRLIRELEMRRSDGRYGRASVAELLVSLLRITPAEAKARVRDAGDLGTRRTLQGEPLPPLLPATAQAVERGEVSSAHVAVIAKAVDAVPAAAPAGAADIVESTLVEVARHEHPGALAKTATLLLARLDPDGLEPKTAELERRRQWDLRTRPDGSGDLHGQLTPEATAVWTAIIDALSSPVGQCGSAGSEPGSSELPQAGGDGMDQRSAAQRRHDAFVEAGRRLLNSGSLPPAGGTPVTVVLRVDVNDLAHGNGVAHTDRGSAWPLRDLVTCLSDAEIVPVLTNHAGAVLALGRTQRLASRAQRLALAARDGGCSFPSCERPAPWTEAHHVISWLAGGCTDLDNLTLVCRFHHRNFEAHGWRVRILDGLPEWLPPPWVDPHQRWRRNRAHHPGEIDFGSRLRAPSAA